MAGRLGGLGGGDDGDLHPSADINVTSLVDVAFVLLIIFMIAAPMMSGGVDVQLPRAEAKPLPSTQAMVVSVDREGRIFIDETRVSYNDFRVTFRALVESRKPEGVYLRDWDVGTVRGRAAVLAVNATIFGGVETIEARPIHIHLAGRTTISELLVVNDAVRRQILESGTEAAIQRAALEGGMVTMFDDGLAKALRGETTIDEVLRVTRMS